MKYLATELQKYYHKTHNKLIFLNGLSLNQLALEIWTKLGYENMDPSLLSRIIHGDRLFTKDQLFVFCRILGLNEIDKYSLENALGKDLLYKHIGEIITISEYDELIANEHISKTIFLSIKKLKDKGRIKEAMQIASFFESSLSYTPKIRKINSVFYARILNEKVRCLTYTENPNLILSKSRELNNIALRIGHETRNPSIVSVSHVLIGECFYLAKKIKESTCYFEKTFDMVNERTKAEYIKTLLYNYAFLQDHNAYKEVYKKAEKILSEKEKYNKNHIISIYETLSRSLAIIGDIKGAIKLLQSLESQNLTCYYQSQIIRGKMFVYYQKFLKKGKFDIDEVRQLFKESKHDKFNSFKRHQGEIEKMYKQMTT